MNSLDLLKIIEDNPGISHTSLRLEVIKHVHPKEMNGSNISALVQQLIDNEEIKTLTVELPSQATIARYFPSAARFYFS